MLTARAWWLLFLAVVMLLVGLYGGYSLLVVLGLTLLAWVSYEGILFVFRVRWVVRDLQLERHLRDEQGRVTTLWSGRSFHVETTLALRGVFPLPYVTWSEMVPFGIEVSAGSVNGDGSLAPKEPLKLTYTVIPRGAGQVRFEGAKVVITDLQGLFCHTTFVRQPTTLRVLPALIQAEAQTATTKRYNLLPPPGINRLPRPGSGSELLDLRDYMPGDPPKTIAWKVSARRDKLITKEYESEVPVRCTLFLDTAQSVRLGARGMTPLARLVEIAAATAQANMGIRDLTGLCLFDETRVTKLLRPARTRRQLIQILNTLADAAALVPSVETAQGEPLLLAAYAFAREVYPDLLRAPVNRVPWWLPIVSPTPGPWVTKVGRGEDTYRVIFLVLGTLVYLLGWAGVLVLTSQSYQEVIPEEWFNEEIDIPPLEFLIGAELLWGCIFYPVWVSIIRDVLPAIVSTRRRRFTRYRKQLAAVLSRRYDLGPGGLELLFQDDDRLGVYLQRFLEEHQIPFTPTLYDAKGQYLFRSAQKVEVLAGALLRAVGKGHDNELFVLLVDLLDVQDDLAPLLRAVKVALGRHHQVLVVCPWPHGVEPPGDKPPSEYPPEAPPARAPALNLTALKARELRRFIRRQLTRRYHESFHQLRRTFARLHVPVVCAASDESVHLLLERLDRLRGMRKRR